MSEIVIFEEDAQKVEVRLEGETAWPGRACPSWNRPSNCWGRR